MEPTTGPAIQALLVVDEWGVVGVIVGDTIGDIVGDAIEDVIEGVVEDVVEEEVVAVAVDARSGGEDAEPVVDTDAVSGTI
jgi:hypothetical protein